MNQRMTEESLQNLQESQISSSPSISQQQNCWFNHQPSLQYPILISESHSVIMEMSAALSPMHIPYHDKRQHTVAQ